MVTREKGCRSLKLTIHLSRWWEVFSTSPTLHGVVHGPKSNEPVCVRLAKRLLLLFLSLYFRASLPLFVTSLNSACRSQDSSVVQCCATVLMIGCSSPSTGWEFSFFTTLSRPALRPTQPPIQSVPGALSLGVKRQGREADHSPPSSAEVKIAWNYTSTPPVRLHDVVPSEEKRRDNFTFTLNG
jgi:hypothetical protein